ncbi:trypco2 family protein [Nocardia sp. NPDC050717]|uniref:trypco2 family protein n=1 Tax=Nocardia sp. NPDC050717 TaxID=3157221 RepID=UPI0033E7D12F
MEIELADAVAALRDELLTAAAQGAGAGLNFEVGPIELSFEVELRRDASVKAGFKAWVVNGEAKAGLAYAHTQRVTLTLTPKNPSGGGVLVGSDQQQRVPGAEDERYEP